MIKYRITWIEGSPSDVINIFIIIEDNMFDAVGVERSLALYVMHTEYTTPHL